MTTRAMLLAVVACGDPPPMVLDYALSPMPQQACTTATGATAASCSDVTMRCDATLSVRIVPRDDPTAPFVSVCSPITGRKNLCSIAGVEFPPPNRPVPAETLEVQVAIYPTAALCSDPSDPTGMTKLCPTNVLYDDATGLPQNIAPICDPDASCCPPKPAIGGRAWYHSGDKTTTVYLGCTDDKALDDPSCAGPSTVTVAATVNDFDTGVSVSPTIADQLSVSVGEPKPVTTMMGTAYVLQPSDTSVLPRTVIQPVPGWDADVALAFTSAACLDVLEDAPQSTAALACRPVTMNPPRIDLVGYRLAKTTLDQILAAIRLSEFPPQGLVVGVVLDDNGNPLSSYVVTATAGTVQYLSADRMSIVTGGTSTNGIFLSQDAPFGTTFTTTHAQLQIATGYGGLVGGKVTVVPVQFFQPIAN